MRDLTRHLTARADDSHAAPVRAPPCSHGGRSAFAPLPRACQALVRFFVLHRIKPHAPLLVRAPVNSLEFQPCGRTPQAGYFARQLRPRRVDPPRPSIHRLQLGIPGYLILISPLAFASERQGQARKPPSPLVFLPISAHSTATPGIPLPSPALKPRSIGRPLPVEPGDFTPNLHGRLHALYAQ